MAISDVSSKSFANDLMRLSLSIIWKDQGKALAAETDENRMDAEAYLVARRGELNFYSMYQFHPQVLQAFFPNPDELVLVSQDKRLIPESKRDAIVQAEQEFLIDYWENQDGEKNAYYRKLFGLPPIDIDPKNLVYNTKYASFDMTTPIHLMSYSDRLKLEKMGYLDELVKEVTDGSRDYLKYCGTKRIYPYISRQAEPFELLYMAECSVKQLKNDFVDVYEAARRMMVRVYYNDAYRNQTELYDGFLALCILFMAQQRMCSKYIETNISRDFYDLDSLRVLYDAYGVPFYSEIPLTYHTKIVKRLNELLSYKGSTQVFYDLFSIFDFGTMDVFEYFLVKRRLVDINGNPVFRDMYGKKLSEQAMWELRFARIAWKDDKFVEVTNRENIIPYDELTVPDPYWVEDKQLQDKLYKSDWNYFHSKYLGVQIMFDLTKLIFETCYFLRLLEDNRGTTEEIHAYYMVTGTDEPLYDLVIYAIALLCKNAGYTGEIPTDPSSIAAVYGFNFAQYNEILKLCDTDISGFVIALKEAIWDFIGKNDVLASDAALAYWVNQVTDGAFSYLGDDFPYGEAHKAPPPMFLHDFIPTHNSITNLKEYLSQTIKQLNENDENNLIDVEFHALYQRLQFSDESLSQVKHPSSAGMTTVYHDFYFSRQKWTDEQKRNIHKAILASYSQLLSLITQRIKIRESVVFDPHILQMIQDMNINDVRDVCEVYDKIDDLDTYLTYCMQNCHDRIAYEAYYNARKILMTTRLMNETFAKRNGDVHKTYADILSEVNPKLWQRLTNEETDCEAEEQYVIQTLMNLCDRLKLLQGINTDNIQRIINYLMKILMFLKSAKVDLVDFEIIYLISDRNANYLKFISEIWAQDVEDGHLKDYIWLIDKMHLVRIWQVLEDHLYLSDPNLGQKVIQGLKDQIDLWDDGEYEVEILGTDAFQYWFAMLTDCFVNHTIPEELTLLEHIHTTIRQRLPDTEWPLNDLDPPIVEVEWDVFRSHLFYWMTHQFTKVIQKLDNGFMRIILSEGNARVVGHYDDAFVVTDQEKDSLLIEKEFYFREQLFDREQWAFMIQRRHDDQFMLTFYDKDQQVEHLLKSFLLFGDTDDENLVVTNIQQDLQDQVIGHLEKPYFESRMGAMDYMSMKEKGLHYANTRFEPATDAILWADRVRKVIEIVD